MVKKAIVLCGGLATRLLPVTKAIPKEMMPILNRPAIDLVIEDLKDNGITDIVVVLGRNKEILENYFDRNIEIENRLKETNKTKELEEINKAFEGLNISFVRQIEPKGTAPAMLKAKSFIGNDDFVLVFPDELMFGTSQTKTLLEEFNKTGKSVLPIKQIDIKDCHKYGMVAVKPDGNGSLMVEKIVEKPKTVSESPSDLCSLGGGVFKGKIFEYLLTLKDRKGEVPYTDALEIMAKKGELYAAKIDGNRNDIGSPLGFVEANINKALMTPELSGQMREYILELAKKLKQEKHTR